MARTLGAFNETLRAKYDFWHFTDFPNFATGTDGWTSLVADGGTATVSDGADGILAIAPGAVDNNEADVRTTTELFLPTAAAPSMYGVASIQFTEANTSAMNCFVGFCSALAANTLVDDGGGVRTSGSIFGIYKIDGGTVWRCQSRNGSTSTDSISAVTAGGASYQLLEVKVEPFSTLQCVATYYVNGAILRDSTTSLPIEHKVNYASLTEMNFGFYAKCGSGSAETLNVDWAGCGKVRANIPQ